ncbi:biliverdin-producing heme oxygenase [Leucobacter luti]|nr:biliverdin-producing heme oxygenase [Leucobacter luti]
MNGDHTDDNLLIARAFGYPGVTESRMVGVTGDGGVWVVTDAEGDHELTVAWPGGEISERPQIRRQVVELYKVACDKLGISARDEHAPEPTGGDDAATPHAAAHPHSGNPHGGNPHGGNPHGGNPHGGNPHGGNPHGGNPHGGGRHAGATDAEGEQPFSSVIRESSWSDHSDSEGATFMEDIMRGIGTKQDYIDLVVQHYFMYEALEAAATQLVADPAFAGFHPTALVRMPALEADLEYLIGSDWREQIAPVPATAAYAARIREIAEEGWAAGIVAHHYTRYLGDLSGGQMIAKRVAKQHELDAAGIEFYDFSALGAIADFKSGYRAELDALGARLDDAERGRMLDEVRTAYGFNTAVFVDLGKAKAAA